MQQRSEITLEDLWNMPLSPAPVISDCNMAWGDMDGVLGQEQGVAGFEIDFQTFEATSTLTLATVVALDDTEVSAIPQNSLHSDWQTGNPMLPQPTEIPHYLDNRLTGNANEPILKQKRYHPLRVLFDSRTRRILKPVKGNNTKGRSGTLACAVCRKRNSKVFRCRMLAEMG
jgi:hypothetical protein